MTFGWLYGLDLWVTVLGAIVLIAGAAEVGNRLGHRSRRRGREKQDVGTIAAAALGLLALLLAFSFAMAVERYDRRRDLVLEEADAIGTAANYALMLPDATREAALGFLRDYAAIRASLGIPFDPAAFERDVARSVELQAELWRLAVGLSSGEPRSLVFHRFAEALNELNNIHEARLTALRNQMPVEILVMLVAAAMVALGLTGYGSGVGGAKQPVLALIMSITIAAFVGLIFDLNQPHRGLIEISPQALVDALDGLGT